MNDGRDRAAQKWFEFLSEEMPLFWPNERENYKQTQMAVVGLMSPLTDAAINSCSVSDQAKYRSRN